MKQLKKTISQKVKDRARRSLNRNISQEKKNYVIDTSVILNKFLYGLIKRGLKGKIIIPNALIAELENMANKGNELGFLGLDEIAKLHQLKNKYKIEVYFYGQRPGEHHIKYAKSGEIDALIREIAFNRKAILVTADLVQAKSAQAYGLEVIFLRPKLKVEYPKKRKNFIVKLFRK
jgi:ATPase